MISLVKAKQLTLNPIHETPIKRIHEDGEGINLKPGL